MAAPTAIPHPEASLHHHSQSESVGGNNLSRSPTGTSPRSMVSPIYTSAGRSSFSLPGPNSSSTSPTTTTWYSAGFASGNSQRVRSPTAPFGGNAAATTATTTTGSITSAVAPQRDSFTESKHPSHFRTASFGSASNASSSVSSADLRDEPTTPLNSRPSLPLGTSFEQIKSRRDSWSFATAPGNRWSGLASLRERAANGPMVGVVSESAPQTLTMDNFSSSNAGPMGGLLRKFSISGNTQTPPQFDRKSPTLNSSLPLAANGGGGGRPNGPARNDSLNCTASAVTAQPPGGASLSPPQDDYFGKSQPRGRQGSVGSAGSQRRRPSPMGERLLMGHFNAH